MAERSSERTGWSPLRALKSKAGQVLIDAVICTISLSIAYMLRFEGQISEHYQTQLLIAAPIIALARATVHGVLGIYRVVWRYVGIREALLFTRSVLLVSAILFVLRMALPVHTTLYKIPISIIIMEGFFTFLGIATARVVRRIVHERYNRSLSSGSRTCIPTVLVGAGDNGLAVAKETIRHPALGVQPLGYVDDDPNKHGMEIHGLRVYSSIDEVKTIVERLRARQIIITTNTIPAARILEISDIARKLRVDLRIVPTLFELLDRNSSALSLREVRIEDLLSRDPVKPSMSMTDLEERYGGKRILVTGAGGSIGSELCRQLALLRPSALLLLERDETNLFEIHRELAARLGPNCVPLLADIGDRKRMEHIFGEFSPDAVFHAAAFKHVPMMEAFPSAAIHNNVFGTHLLAEVADKFGAESFVLISTDKAVRPTSVMGASKRLAEMVVQNLAQKSKTRFSCVRFGNVLGSRGSVVTIFRDQIRSGGPVTVTHPEVTRYFMTIPEAANLVLQAATQGSSGEIFVLDMGRPVRIIDLARQMIQLSGTTEEKVPIKIMGTRPGEKLYEELQADDELIEPTPLRKVSRLKPRPVDADALAMTLERLKFLARANDGEGLRDELRGLDIEYSPRPSVRAPSSS